MNKNKGTNFRTPNRSKKQIKMTIIITLAKGQHKKPGLQSPSKQQSVGTNILEFRYYNKGGVLPGDW